MRLFLRLGRAVAVGVLLVVAPSIALADPPPAETAVARDQFKLGVDAAQSGKWEEARVAFQRSYDVWPRPLTLLNLAGALAETGHLVHASESYRKFLREAGGQAAEQKPAAEEALKRIETRLPHVRLKANGLLTADKVSLDGAAIANAVVGVPLPIDPGEHKVVVSRGTTDVASTTFKMDEAESKDVTFDVPAPKSGEVVAPPPGPPASSRPDWYRPVPEQPPPAEEKGGGIFSSPWFWGVTGVLVVGGATTGILLATSGSSASAPPPFPGSVPPSRIVVR